MNFRNLRRLGRDIILGGGAAASLLLGTHTSAAQGPTIVNGPPTMAQQMPQGPQVPAQVPPGPPPPAQLAPGPQMPQAVQTSQPAPVLRNYLNKKTIQLPIMINESARASIQEIQLFCKDHPSAPWTIRDKAAPTQREFIFKAATDGEYWFTMVTVDRQGRSYPADLRNEQPGLVVVIDTQAPAVELINIGTTPEGQMIQCDVSDVNLDSTQTRVAYQAGDKQFRMIEPVPGRANIYCVPAQANFTGLVQVTAVDLAQNQTTRQEHVTRMKTPKTEPSPVANAPTVSNDMRVSDALPRQLPMGLANARPIGRGQEAQRPPEGPVNTARPDGSQGPRWGDGKTPDKGDGKTPDKGDGKTPDKVAAPVTLTTSKTDGPKIFNTEPPAPKPVPVPAKRQFVNSTKIYLDYQIENARPGNVSTIEIWLTRDQGQNWHKHAEVNGNKSPIEVVLPGEGIFGLTLVASNGRSAQTPPVAGDQPDSWIEVDTTKPSVQINDIQTTFDKGQPTVYIRWSAQDKNLAETGVELHYAATQQGPWLLIAKGLPGEGQHRWTPPATIGAQVHLRLSASDAAGNAAACATLEPVGLTEVRPRAVIRTISTGAGEPVRTAPQ
jgi:hypothetical protein